MTKASSSKTVVFKVVKKSSGVEFIRDPMPVGKTTDNQGTGSQVTDGQRTDNHATGNQITENTMADSKMTGNKMTGNKMTGNNIRTGKDMTDSKMEDTRKQPAPSRGKDVTQDPNIELADDSTQVEDEIEETEELEELEETEGAENEEEEEVEDLEVEGLEVEDLEEEDEEVDEVLQNQGASALDEARRMEDACMAFLERTEGRLTYHQAQLVRLACEGFGSEDTLDRADYILNRARLVSDGRPAAIPVDDPLNGTVMDFLESEGWSLDFYEWETIRLISRGCDAVTLAETAFVLERARRRLENA